jgi:hypothetical protein
MGDVQLPLANLFPSIKSNQPVGKNPVALPSLRIPPLPQRPFLPRDPPQEEKKEPMKPCLDRRRRVSKRGSGEKKCPHSPISPKPDPDPLPEPRTTRSSTLRKLAESSASKPSDNVKIKEENEAPEKLRKQEAEEPSKGTKVTKPQPNSINIESPKKASKIKVLDDEKPPKSELLKVPVRAQRKKGEPKSSSKAKAKDSDDEKNEESPKGKSKIVLPPKFDVTFYSGAECIVSPTNIFHSFCFRLYSSLIFMKTAK